MCKHLLVDYKKNRWYNFITYTIKINGGEIIGEQNVASGYRKPNG